MNNVYKKEHINFIELVNAQDMARQNPETFEAPWLDVLKNVVSPGMHVKVCGLGERFWVEVVLVSDDKTMIIGSVANNLLAAALKFGDLIALSFEHIYTYPRVQRIPGYMVTEVQIAEMAAVPGEDNSFILKDAMDETRDPDCPVTSYDVLLRMEKFGDPSILESEEWEFDVKDYAFPRAAEVSASEWADALCEQFDLPEPESI